MLSGFHGCRFHAVVLISLWRSRFFCDFNTVVFFSLSRSVCRSHDIFSRSVFGAHSTVQYLQNCLCFLYCCVFCLRFAFCLFNSAFKDSTSMGSEVTFNPQRHHRLIWNLLRACDLQCYEF